MTEASQADRVYLDQIQAHMKQLAAQRAAKEASLVSANEPTQSGPSAKAHRKRHATDVGDNPGWANTFSVCQNFSNR